MKKWIKLTFLACLLIFSTVSTAQDDMFVLASQYSSTLKQGLISCWEMDETSGGFAYDSYATNHMGIAGNTAINQSGILNRSYNFDGTNSQLDLSSATDFAGLSAITISAWIYSTYTTTTDEYRIIASKLHSSWVSPYYQFQLRVRFGSQKVFEFTAGISNNFFTVTSSTNSYFTGFWRHIVGTYDGETGDVRLYVDGEYNVANTPVKIYGPTGTANTPFHIGDDSDIYSNNKNWNGKIDQIAIWNRELTLSEISTLYNNGAGKHFSEW